MNNKNKVDERTDPHGTPASILNSSEIAPTNPAKRDLLDREIPIQAINLVGNLYMNRCVNSPTCHILSNALEVFRESTLISPNKSA